MKRYIIFGFSLLLLSVSPLSAQEKSRVIKGFVKDYSTKLPISGAMVRVAEVEGYSTLSRSDGSYELEVPLFVSSLEISAPETNLVKIGLQKGEQQREVLLYPTTFSSEYKSGTNVTADVSATDFRFSNAVTIEDETDRGYCYTAIHQIGNHLLLAYCAGSEQDMGGCLNRLRIRLLPLDSASY